MDSGARIKAKKNDRKNKVHQTENCIHVQWLNLFYFLCCHLSWYVGLLHCTHCMDMDIILILNEWSSKSFFLLNYRLKIGKFFSEIERNNFKFKWFSFQFSDKKEESIKLVRSSISKNGFKLYCSFYAYIIT